MSVIWTPGLSGTKGCVRCEAKRGLACPAFAARRFLENMLVGEDVNHSAAERAFRFAEFGHTFFRFDRRRTQASGTGNDKVALLVNRNPNRGVIRTLGVR